MSYYNDKITNVLGVLKAIKEEYNRSKYYRNITELRKDAVRCIAESQLRLKRYKNENSAQKTIHDACARRLKPEVSNIADFDNLIDLWLRKGSMRLKNILLTHSESYSKHTQIGLLFEGSEN